MENYDQVEWDDIQVGDIVKILVDSPAQTEDCNLNYEGELIEKDDYPQRSVLRTSEGNVNITFPCYCEVTYYIRKRLSYQNIISREISGIRRRPRPNPSEYFNYLNLAGYKTPSRKRKLGDEFHFGVRSFEKDIWYLRRL